MGEITYIDAIREAQHDLLTSDERVFIYGQDVGHFGGAFKATQGLKKLFPDRVLDSPISEDAMIGLAVGAVTIRSAKSKNLIYNSKKKGSLSKRMTFTEA